MRLIYVSVNVRVIDMWYDLHPICADLLTMAVSHNPSSIAANWLTTNIETHS